MIQKSYDTPRISRVSLALSLTCACLVLQGCGSVKKTLGIDRDPPNEYAVTPSTQPLEMPPDFSCLPTPMPGIERPQDRAARETQEKQFLGSSEIKEASSPGQEALLDMCGVQGNQDQIRYEIDTAARIEDKKGKPIVEKLGIKKTQPKGDALNPYDEVEKLKEQGLLNPNAIHEGISSSANNIPTDPAVQEAISAPYNEAEKLKETALVSPTPVNQLIPPSAERAKVRRAANDKKNHKDHHRNLPGLPQDAPNVVNPFPS